MKRAVSILSVIFILVGAPIFALAGVVPGALLHLDASDNPGHPDALDKLGRGWRRVTGG